MTRARNRIVTGAAALVAPFVFMASPALATDSGEPDPHVVSIPPTSGWALDYAKESCRVGRFFGKGDQRTLLQLTQFEPNHHFLLTVAGGGFDGKPGNDKLTVQFGPHHAPQELDYQGAGIGEFEPGFIITSVGVRETEMPEMSMRESAQERIATFEPSDPITAADEAKVEWIAIGYRGKKRLILETRSMAELFAALKQCSEKLVSDWGIDLERHRARSRPPIPKASPARWVTAKDYPTQMLAKGYQGLVNFRLMIDEEGQPTSCHIQQSASPEQFDTTVCRALMKRARFEPALDAAGEPMPSYYRTAVRFLLP